MRSPDAGRGAPEDARGGAHLERLLEPHVPAGEVEELSLAVTRWNIQAECAYLRRQLGRLHLDDAAALPARLAVPAEQAGRRFVTVRLLADDHASLTPVGVPGCLALDALRLE